MIFTLQGVFVATADLFWALWKIAYTFSIGHLRPQTNEQKNPRQKFKISPPYCTSIRRGAIDHSQEFEKWRWFDKMRFGLVYWLEIVPSALVREIILYSSMLWILFLVWSSDLPLQNSKKIFIGLFCVLGNLEHFLFFLCPQDQKRVDFAIFWLLASRKEENFYLQVEKVEKVDSGTPVVMWSRLLKKILISGKLVCLT